MYTLVICLATLGAPGPKEAPKKEAPSIVGTWVAESAVFAGKADPPPPGATMTFTKEGKCITKEGKDGDEDVAPYTVDSTKKPAHLDLIENAVKKDQKLLAIYKIEGDTLTICLSLKGGRPEAFASAEQTPTILITLKRAKKE